MQIVDNSLTIVNDTTLYDDTIKTSYLPYIADFEDINSIVANYYFIKLPIRFRTDSSNLTLLNNGINDLFVMILDQNNTITFKNIAGIPLANIQANYPVNNNQSQGFYDISGVDTNNIYYNCGYKALNNQTGGGANIIVSKIIQTISGYPNSNEYSISLQRAFHNVIKIELISTEFYNSEKIVKSYPESKRNNRLYWMNIEDGNYVYSVEIPEGDYASPDDIITILKTKMNSILRINSTSSDEYYHDFDITLDTDTNLIIIYSRKIVKLNVKPLIIDKVYQNGEDRYRMTIKHVDNSVQVGDTVQLFNAISTNGIPSNVINQEHTVIEIDIINETYTVLLPSLNLSAITSSTGGGDNVNIRVNLLSKFFFNKSDTLGTLLGFRDVGESHAITKYSAQIKNTDLYAGETQISLDYTGNPKINPIPQLNFSGEYFYFFLYLNDYEGILTSSNLKPAFAKIVLNGLPNDVMFNSYVNHPVIFDHPILQLDELLFKYVYPDGENVMFNNIDHSLTLRITELMSHPHNTRLNSKLAGDNTSFIREYNFQTKTLVKK